MKKVGTIKDKNNMDLTAAEDIKRWQKHTEELYKKSLGGLNSAGIGSGGRRCNSVAAQLGAVQHSQFDRSPQPGGFLSPVVFRCWCWAAQLEPGHVSALLTAPPPRPQLPLSTAHTP